MPRLRKTKTVKVKKIKLQSKARIRRRLFKKWSEKVRERDGHECIKCHMGKTDPGYTKLDAHHYLQRNIKDSPLKFDIRDGGTLCPSCHKFNGEHSAHKSPIVFYDWLRQARPDDYKFVLGNAKIRVDLDNREILAEIEARLDAGEGLDLTKLMIMDMKAKDKTNEDNSIGQVLPHVHGEQNSDAVVPVHGSDSASDKADMSDVARGGSATAAST